MFFFQKFLNCLGRGKVITSHLGYRKQSALQQLSCFCFSNSQHLRNFFYAVLPEIVILAEIQLFFCYYKNHLRGYYCVKEPHTFPHRFLRPSRPRKGCTVYIWSKGSGCCPGNLYSCECMLLSCQSSFNRGLHRFETAIWWIRIWEFLFTWKYFKNPYLVYLRWQ